MICVACNKFYKLKRSGVVVEEMMPQGEGWVPYKLWMADLYSCPSCEKEILGGFSLGGPMAEHYQSDYRVIKDVHQPQFQIRDCGNTHFGWRPHPATLTQAQLDYATSQARSLLEQLENMKAYEVVERV